MTSFNSNLDSLQKLLGKKLLENARGARKDTAWLLKGKDLVALFLSNSTSQTCQTFTPPLVKFYNTIQQNKNNKVAIIYVSSDRTEKQFETYYAKMPFWAVLHEQAKQVMKNLPEAVRAGGIPSLVILDAKTGNFVTSKGLFQVIEAVGNDDACTKVVTDWKAMKAVSFKEATKSHHSSKELNYKGFLRDSVAQSIIFFIIIFLVSEFRRGTLGELLNGWESAVRTMTQSNGEI